ncbi:MAG: glutathione S-transferase [Gammaproteobacteria bacterium]|nr:glutathione S-transferase [Gammaproteobacteria bacterium]
MIKLYTGLGSGNSYKAELLLHLLAVSYTPVPVSIPKGEHLDPAFLRLTPFGQIPVLVDGDAVFTDSQAILCYLARAYGGAMANRWLPIEPGQIAAVMRWLSFAANEIQNGPTMARAAKLLRWAVDYDRAVASSYRSLRLMDRHLAGRDWLATGAASIADIACYPYLLLASEGGIDTTPFSAVTAWMRRLESLPGFWPMPRIPNLPPVPLVPYERLAD